MFNLDASGNPVIRKATAHGLGHLLPPYRDEEDPADLPAPAVSLKDIGVRRWQHDLWHSIIRATLAGSPDRPDFSKLPNFDRPAVSQYAVTTARLAKWFDLLNAGRSYSAQVRPFNFMLMFQPKPLADWAKWRRTRGLDDSDPAPPCVIAPYESDLLKSTERCFDRDTGTPVPTEMLKTYRDSLAQYHLRPESKFLNADYCDYGETQRRHIKVASVVHIGKEANRWEEQSYLGVDSEAEVSYGSIPKGQNAVLKHLRDAADSYGLGKIAKAAEISRQQLAAIITKKAVPTPATVDRLYQAVCFLQLASHAISLDAAAITALGVRKCAALIGIDAGHLSRVVSGRRKLTAQLSRRLQHIVRLT